MNLNTFLYPKSVAVIGASRDKKKIGYQILNNIITNNFRGKIYPINLKESEIEGLRAYKSIANVHADLAIIAIPVNFVLNEIEKCAKAGVKNITIISAGFSEDGEEGRKREEKLKMLAKIYRLNILGPNCLGMMNSANNLNATFAKSEIKKGRAAFISQSGAICSAALDWAQGKDFGFSKFVSLGNKAVLDENDFFEYFAKDKETDLVVAYLEEIEDGKRFMEVVSRLSKIKPVAILKAGQSEAGALAAMSHTGSIAGSNEAVLAGFKRAGVIVLENIEEMFDLLLFYGKHKKIKGNDVVLISNAGGPMVATVDLLSKNGINLNKFSRELVEELKEVLPGIVKVQDPLDLIGDADADRFKKAIEAVLDDKKVTNVLILLTPQTSTEVKKTAEIISSLAAHHKDKVVFTSFMGGKSIKSAKAILEKGGITNFDFPNKDVNILSKIINYENDKKKLRIYNSGKKHVFKRKGEQLDYIETFKILKKFNIPAVETHKVTDQNDLRIMSYPAVLKAVGKKIVHKTERRAVALGIKNRKQAEKTLKEFEKILTDKNYCVSQPMITGDLEMIIGFRRDKSFGPIIMVGMGGIYTEIFKDVQLGVEDINSVDIQSMLEALKIYPILKGARGKHGYDLKVLNGIILNVMKLAQKRTDIYELDINPLVLKGNKIIALDARIVI